jgi:hypothetical protein
MEHLEQKLFRFAALNISTSLVLREFFVYSMCVCLYVGNVLSELLSLPEDRLCGLVVRVPGYTTEMYCVSCEVRTEFIYVM